tara:strand:- start:1018 stop:2445 length:1428 start_codon:yes stop_codon:yes gene_type:complete
MKTKTWITLIIFHAFISMSFVTLANSSPISSHIEYYCIGQDSFSVTLKSFNNCANPNLPDSVKIHVQSACLDSFDIYLGNKSTLYSPCKRSTCWGGDLQGAKQVIYTGILILNSSCTEWDLSYSEGIRDSSVNLIGTPNAYLETKIMMDETRCNSSPILMSNFNFVTLNQFYSLNIKAYDPEGAILNYFFSSPLVNQDTDVVFKPGYSTNQPINGITLDSLSGQIEFTPTTLGKFHASIRINEYSPQLGNLLSSTLVNIMFEVTNPINHSPISPNGIAHIVGPLHPIGMDTFQIPPSQLTSFDIDFMDTDTLDSVSIYTNASAVLQSSFVHTVSGNPATISISWTATNQNGTYTFSTTVTDDQCMVGLTIRDFTFIVGNGINDVPQLMPSDFHLEIAPNPVTREMLSFRFELPATEKVSMQVYNLIGTEIISLNNVFNTGLNSFSLPITGLSNGKYILQLSTRNGRQTIPFLKVD